MKKSNLSVFVAFTILWLPIITACSSSQAVEPTSITEDVEEDSKEKTPILSESVTTKMTEDNVESSSESLAEPVVYEGIDMESVLPGEQWVASFKGIVHEPKLVVFNDETNKKIIVEEGQEIEFSFTDKIAIFIPDGHTGGYVANKGYVLLNGYGNYNSSGITVLDTLASNRKKGDSVPLEVTIEYDGEKMTLSAILNLVE